MAKTNPTLMLNGQQYEILDQIRIPCDSCYRTLNVLLLSREFYFTIGGFGYRAKHECYYCSVSGELFVDRHLKDKNQRAVNDVVFPHGRGTSINSRR